MSEGPSAALGERRGRRLLGQSESAPGGGRWDGGGAGRAGWGRRAPEALPSGAGSGRASGSGGAAGVRLCILEGVFLVPGTLGPAMF